MRTKRLHPSFEPAPNRWFTSRDDGSGSDDGDGDGDGGSGNGDSGNGNGDGGSQVDVEEIVSKAVEEATKAANSTADKRINQILDRLEKSQSGSDGDGDDGTGDGGQGKSDVFTEREKRMQRRLLAAALRDEVKRLPDSIQSSALKLAKSVTDRMEFDDSTDEDEVAVEVVKQVEEQLDEVKTTFETGLREDLKSRGLLKDDGDGDGGQGPDDGDDGDGSGKDDPKKQYEAGAAKAKEMFEPENKE